MRVLGPLLLFALATNAAPAVVTEIVTEIAPSTATPAPPSQAQAQIQMPVNSNKNNNINKQESGGMQLGKPQKAKKPPSAPNKKKEAKYFHEPGWDLETGHYDARYFQGKVPYASHRPALRHLVRSYLSTFRALGLETWLAHGSLLGWWWNGRVMPWDYDLDVQVSVATLALMAERHNGSLHEYEYEVDGDEVGGLGGGGGAKIQGRRRRDTGKRSEGGEGEGGNAEEGGEGEGEGEEMPTKIKKTYLLDVNPHYVALTKGNGANVIDARWIDTSNGMFIDITGIRERDVEHNPGVWSCKNNHKYRTAELWPLRRTEFEGVEAWIPYNFDKVLTDEYGPKSLVKEEWAGHRWFPELREWIKVPKKDTSKEKENKKSKPSPPKKEENKSTGNKGVETVVIYEEVIVEV
ncbi:LicD family-domain-containing protein [Nemania sp. FL0916]|nr:LicD family-domain-containing protein [Nemania sp. FL0916]